MTVNGALSLDKASWGKDAEKWPSRRPLAFGRWYLHEKYCGDTVSRCSQMQRGIEASRRRQGGS